MHHRSRGIVVALTTLLLAVSCSGSSAKAGAADFTVRDGGRLRVGVTALAGLEASSLDMANSGAALAADLLYDGLTAYRGDEQRVVPAIALNWSTPDGVHWTFTLDPSRTFSNGSPITANDVVASLGRVAKMANKTLPGARLAMIEGVTAYASGAAAEISGLVVGDPHTLSITTREPFQELPALLAGPGYGIAPANPPTGGSAVVGSGPFKVDAMDATHVVLDRVSPALAHVAGIDLMIYPNDTEALQAFDRGELDISPLPAEAAVRDPQHSMSTAQVYLGLNVDAPQMGDPAVRGALLRALDRTRIVASVPNRRATVAEGFVPEVIEALGTCGAPCTMDRRGSAETLRANTEMRRTFTLGFLDGADLARMAGEIKAQFAEVGVDVELHPQTSSELSAALSAGSNDMVLFGLVGLAPTPDPYLADSFGSSGSENTTNFSSPELDATIIRARSTPNDRERLDAYRDVERLVLASAVAIPIASLHHDFVSTNVVHGDESVAGVMFDGRLVWLSKR